MSRSPAPVVALALFIAPGLAGCSGGDRDIDTAPPTVVRAPEPLLAAGTEIAIELTDDLFSDSSRTGDPFDAIVARDVNSSNALQLIAAGSRARGTVTLARRGGSHEPALLAIRIESVFADGRWHEIRATAIEADLRGDPVSDSTATLAVGPAVPPLLRRLARPGDDEASVVGLDACAGVALVRNTGRIALLEGSRLRLRLDAPIGRR